MNEFNNIPNWIKRITHTPEKIIFEEDMVRDITLKDLKYFASLWLTEGIPYAFKNSPELYEALRITISKPVGLDQKTVNIVGSARLGFSLNPKNLLREYNKEHSDLDLFIVSENAYNMISNEINPWIVSYEEKVNAENENSSLPGNIISIKKNAKFNFIDTWNVPNIVSHPYTLKLNRSLNTLKAGLLRFPDIPQPKQKFGIRVFKDWNAAINRSAFNLRSALCSFYGIEIPNS